MELISFKLCPFVQRTVITLLEKNADFKISYIDLNNPPDWFPALSPLGKVPVMKTDDGTVLFESAVICEYADDIRPPSLHPADPLRRAQNKAWIAFGAECIFAQFDFYTANSAAALETARTALDNKLQHLDKIFGDGPFFNGDSFSLVDAAYAPLFMRFGLIDAHFSLTSPRLRAWQEHLLARDSVKKSVVEEFPTLFQSMLTAKGSVLA